MIINTLFKNVNLTCKFLNNQPRKTGGYYRKEDYRFMNEKEVSSKLPVTDRRVRKTRTALKNSLTTLLQQKNVKDISVKELTDLADVNRGTFYLHYNDVFDLLEQSENDLLNELHQIADGISAETVRSNPTLFFEKVYTVCSENANLVRILLGENGDIRFLNHIRTFLREKCLNDWHSLLHQIDLEKFDAYYSFLVGGCCSLLQYWFATDMKQTPQELAKITVEFLNRRMGGAGGSPAL